MDVKISDQITGGHDVTDAEEIPKKRICLQKWNQPLYKRKLVYTGTLYFGMFMYGWIVAIKGPSLLDLQEITSTDTVGGASFFTSAAVGSVIGSLVGGSVYDRLNKQLTLFISMLMYALTCALIPYCTSYWSMIAIFFLNEFLIGGFKTGSNVEILNLWGDESKHYMQGLHFCFSLGASLSPLVLQPFLSNGYSKPFNTTFHDAVFENNFTAILESVTPLSNVTVQNASLPVFSEYTNSSQEDKQSDASRIHIPYIISGVMATLSALGLLIRFFHEKNTPLPSECQLKESKHHSVYPRWTICITLVLFLFLYFFLDEVEDSSPSFLATFVIRGLGWNKLDGARITSAFWAAFTAGRLGGTISISFLTHFQFFIICSSFLLLAQIGLVLSGLFHVDIGVWLSIILVGVSIAVVLPASLTWMEKEFVSVSGKVMSVIFVALSLGGMANPQLIGYMIQHVTYMGYCYILLAETLFFVLTLAVLKVFLEKVLKRYRPVAISPEAEGGDCETPINNINDIPNVEAIGQAN